MANITVGGFDSLTVRKTRSLNCLVSRGCSRVDRRPVRRAGEAEASDRHGYGATHAHQSCATANKRRLD